MFMTPYQQQYAKGGLATAYGTYSRYRSRVSPNAGWGGAPSQLMVSRKRKRPTGKFQSFKKKLYDNTPAKHSITADNASSITGGLHNTIYTLNLSAVITQGTADNQRVGDSVQLMAVKLNGLISSNALITASCQWRIIVGWSGEEYNLPSQFTVAGLSITELFQPGSGAIWRNTGIINPKAFTVLDDRIWTLNNSISNVADIEEVAYTVQINANLPYQSGGSVYGKTRSLYVVAIPCSLGGVSGTTNSGNLALATDLIYKQV